MWQETGRGFGGRRQRRKHKESLSPPRQLHQQNLSGITILESWSMLKVCNLQGTMGGKLWSISVHCSSYTGVATYPPRSAMCQASCTCIPGAACTQLAGVKVRKKDLVLQIWMICVLAVCWLCKEVSSSYCCITLHCCNPLFLWPKWFPGDLKGWCPSSYLCHFSFSILLGTRYYQTRTFRNNCNVWGKLESDYKYLEGKKWLKTYQIWWRMWI